MDRDRASRHNPSIKTTGSGSAAARRDRYSRSVNSHGRVFDANATGVSPMTLNSDYKRIMPNTYQILVIDKSRSMEYKRFTFAIPRSSRHVVAARFQVRVVKTRPREHGAGDTCPRRVAEPRAATSHCQPLFNNRRPIHGRRYRERRDGASDVSAPLGSQQPKSCFD
jgi:hypothetical protein